MLCHLHELQKMFQLFLDSLQDDTIQFYSKDDINILDNNTYAELDELFLWFNVEVFILILMNITYGSIINKTFTQHT